MFEAKEASAQILGRGAQKADDLWQSPEDVPTGDMEGKIKGRKKKETGHRSTNCRSLWSSRAHLPFLLCPFSDPRPQQALSCSYLVSQNSMQMLLFLSSSI